MLFYFTNQGSVADKTRQTATSGFVDPAAPAGIESKLYLSGNPAGNPERKETFFRFQSDIVAARALTIRRRILGTSCITVWLQGMNTDEALG